MHLGQTRGDEIPARQPARTSLGSKELQGPHFCLRQGTYNSALHGTETEQKYLMNTQTYLTVFFLLEAKRTVHKFRLTGGGWPYLS